MPIDNDYFKNRQKNGGDGSNKKYQAPFDAPDFFKNFGKKAGFIYAIIIIIVILIIARPFTIVNSGEVGIEVTTGKFEQQALQPGLHFFIPFLQKIILVDTKVRLINYRTNEKISGSDSGIKINPAISILDARGLPVSIEITVQYRLRAEQAPKTIATWGLSWEDKIVNPVVRDIVRNVVGSFNAEELPSHRNQIATMIGTRIRKQIQSLKGEPVVVESVQLRQIVLPPKIKAQIEQVQIANQQAQRVKYEVLRAQQEAQKKAALAKGTAQAVKIEAQGRASAVTIEADAHAKANKLIAKSLTPRLLKLKQIQVQGKFNEALKVNKDAKIFLTPGGVVPNLWINSQSKKRTSSLNH